MNHLKYFSKRSLALLLTLVMCLGMLQITAFAEEEHTHNEGGWTCISTVIQEGSPCTHEHDENCNYAPSTEGSPCTHEHDENCGYVAPTEEVPCQHAHDESCGYVAPTEEVPCTHEHTDECYTKGEDVLTCDLAAHEHGTECYDTEGTLTCELAEHTHGDECYTEGEPVLNCKHVHNEECGYAPATEGSPCKHVHDENCGYVAPVEEVPCQHAHDENCGYVAPVEEVPCTHVHDDSCGYAEAVVEWTCTPPAEKDPDEPAAAATIGENSYETLQDAINAAQSGDTIVLTKDFSPTGDEKRGNDWLNMVTASKTPELTIDLDGHTIDCGNQFGWLAVNGKMDLTVKNGTIQNAGNCSQGSAIWAFGTLTLENMTIQDCTCTSFGGAVFVGGSHGDANLTVTNCTFTGNSARDGGAIWFAEGHKADISNTTFTKNTAKSVGGAVYVNGDWESETAVVTLSSCTFENNEALAGGAVSSYDNCTLTVTGCTFTDNRANGGSGGAINAAGNQAANMPGTLTVNGATFIGNTAVYGGAVYASYLYPSRLENVTFDGNAAGMGYGGAAYCYAVQMTLDNVTATNNSASYYGGGFFLQKAPTDVTGSTITGNNSGQGGGLYCTQSAVTVSGSKITGNNANFGGGIVNYFDKLTLKDGAEVHNNTAKKSGDDIYSSDAKYHETYPASLELVVAENAVLESDGKTITGWFIDGQEGETTTTDRWSAEGFYKEFDGENSVVALKAAHGADLVPAEPRTLSYNANGGSGTMSSQTVAMGESVTVAPNGFSRSGYTFTGWNTMADGTGTAYSASDFINLSDNVTLYAQWRYNGGGEGGGGGSTPDPDPDPTPDVDVPDPDVPLVEEPEVELPEEDVPLAEEPVVELPEEDVPLAEEPEVEIPEEDVPLADTPQTGDASLLWYLASLLSACGLAFLNLRKKNRS